jgi:NhaP-type Na+/H+ or K+/H+ antiporter
MQQETQAAVELAVTVLAVGVGAQWVAWKMRVPAIILLVAGGLIVGPFTPDALIRPGASGEIVQIIVSLCVAVILFEGGLSLHRGELKAAPGVERLVYIGVPLAFVFGSLAAFYVGGLTYPVALVFGAIMVVTGPTVILPLLRQAALNRRTASYFKWEGIVNDPIGALLAVLLFQFFVYAGEGDALDVVINGLGRALLAGLVLGGLGGWAMGRAFQAAQVPEYLKSPVMLTAVLIVYVAANHLQREAGLLAVTIMGIVVGNMHLPGLQDMKRFKEYITVILVSVVFVLLSAGLTPESLARLDWQAFLLVAMILFLVRPAAILLATLGSDMGWPDRLMLAWIAPRGIVAAATAGVMGPGLVEAGYETADLLLPLVFAVIFATVVLHGLSIGPVSKMLGLSSPARDSVLIVGASPWSVELGRTLKELGLKVLVADGSWHNLRAARLAGLPVFYGEILSEFADESVELAHVQTVLCATDNDAYNALVCTALAPDIGRDRVFQLAMGSAYDTDPRGVSAGLTGNVAFNSQAEYEWLWERHVAGWQFSKTRITEEYTYSDLLGDLPGDAMKTLILRDERKVRFIRAGAEIEPEPGDVLVFYGPPRTAERRVHGQPPGQESEEGEKQDPWAPGQPKPAPS